MQKENTIHIAEKATFAFLKETDLELILPDRIRTTLNSN
jgi:hypothetical protein